MAVKKKGGMVSNLNKKWPYKEKQYSTSTYTKYCDESVHRWDLKACNTCKITSSKEGNIE